MIAGKMPIFPHRDDVPNWQPFVHPDGPVYFWNESKVTETLLRNHPYLILIYISEF